MILEPNDLISEASDSGIGDDRKSKVTFSSNINTSLDVDLYRFELEQGQGITLDIDTINLTQDSSKFDSYLRVFDANGNELSSNDDSFAQSDSGLDSYVGFIANSTGQYYVGVSDTANRDYNPIEIGEVDLAEDNSLPRDYDLTLKIVEVEPDKDPDNTVTEAIALSFDRDRTAVVSKEIATESDVDLYEIELGEAKGVKLNIDTQKNPSDLDSYLRVFDADGQEVAFNDNSEDLDNITSDSILAFAPETGGKYYIGVSSAGNFDYDAVNGDTNLNFSPNTAVSTGNYELGVEIVDVVKDNDNNNTIAEAIATSVGATDSNSAVTKSEEIDSKFDVDIFKFQLQEGEGVKLDINASESGSDLDSYLRIFDSQGNELSVDDNNDANFTGDFSSDSSLAFVPDTPGEYYVGVGTSGNFDYDPINGRTNFSKDNLSPFTTTGSYELVINPTAVVSDEDPDNTIASAIATQGDSSIVGEIEARNDVDVYKFELESGYGVTFDLSADPEDSNLDSYLRLFDSLGNELASDNDDDNNIAGDSNFDSLLRFVVDTSGEYYLGVSSDGNIDYNPIEGSNNFTPTTGRTTGSYSLAIDRSPLVADTDPDNTITEAIKTKASLAEPITISQTIDSFADVDIYQLDLDAGNTVSLDIDAAEIDSELDSVLQIFNADGEKLATNDDASAPDENSAIDSYLEFTALTAGSYYVGVSSYDNFDYDALNGSNNFSNDFGNTTGNYNLVVDLID